MLDAEARLLLDLMEKAVKDGRPRLRRCPTRRAAPRSTRCRRTARPSRSRSARSTTAASPGPAARSASAATCRSASTTGKLPTLDLLSRRRLRDRQHRDPRFDLPAARQQEPLPGDLDRLSAGARASLPGADRRRRGGLPPYPRQRRDVRRRSERASPSAAIRRAAPSLPWSARSAAMPARRGEGDAGLPDADLSRDRFEPRRAPRARPSPTATSSPRS